MIRRALSLLCLSFASLIAVSQPADTVIYAEGSIFNAKTKESVEAQISFQSLPYGSRIGMLNGSSYRLPLYDKERYEITIDAPGFAQYKLMLDPKDADDKLRVIRDIPLELPGSAVKVAATTHHVGKVMRLDNLIFQLGKAKIAPESYPELDSLVKMLNDNPGMVIQLEGHTDVLGDPKENMKLSQARVDQVRNYLVNKGVAKAKVLTRAFGGTQPLSRANTEAAHKLNRRVEVRIVQND
ncbi:MAG: OmpA family protein [Cyclobacteriaceae bacterium]